MKNYLSFLLRLWRIRQDDHDVWRASLEDSRTGEQRGFANLDTLVKFLFQQTQSGEGEKQNNQILEKDKD